MDNERDILVTKPRRAPPNFNMKVLAVVLAVVLLASCAIVFLVAFKGANPPKSTCPIPEFDYLLQVIRWAPSVCKTSKCIKDYDQSWVIHGLWPNYWNGTWPQFCCNTDPFDVKQVASLETELNVKWPNLEYNQTSESFWAHEWDKHGTCAPQSKKLVGELEFFTATLSLYDTTPLGKWLSASGINPDDATTLTEANVLAAIQKNLPFKIELDCTHGKGSDGKDVYWLDTIQICRDKNTLKLIDCPTPKDTCKKGMIYPTKA